MSKNNNGLLDLSVLENAGQDDVLDLPLVGNDDYMEAFSDPDGDVYQWIKDPKANKDKLKAELEAREKWIKDHESAPGGPLRSVVKSTERVKDALKSIGESVDVNVSVPGGLNEKPSGQPADQTIPVPAKKDITADVYNTALANLKKSFKEAVEVMEMLENVTVVQKTADQLQEEYTEDVIAEAVFSSYADGPIYEAVDKANKAEIKGIAKKIRKELCKLKRNINWYTGKKSSGAKLGLLDPIIISSRNRKLELKAWQLVCLVCPQRKVSLGKVLDDLNEEFSEILGDYKLKFIKMNTYNLTAKAKDLTEEDKNKSRSIFKMYILVVDDNSDKEAALEVELDESNMEKLRNAIGGTSKNINEFVDFMISESKECDDECCDSEKNKKKDD